MLRPLPFWLLPGCFLVCALPLLTFLAIQVPTGESPDEVAHIIRMDSVRRGELIGQRRPYLDALGKAISDSGVRANAALLATGFSFQPGTPIAGRVMTRERAQALANYPWEPTTAFVSIPNTGIYPPVFYMPGAAAMQLAVWLGRPPLGAIHWGRLGNGGCYVVLGLAALLLARRLQGLFFAALILPMSLWLAASANQDGPVIAAAVLSAALLTRRTQPAWWGAIACFALVAMAKPPYLPLAILFMVYVPTGGLGWPARIAGGACAALPAVAWFVFAQKVATVPFIRGGPFNAGPYWPGTQGEMFGHIDPALQLQVLLNRPSLMLQLPLEVIGHSPFLGWEFIGVLAILDLLLPLWMYAGWSWALIALLVGDSLRSRHEAPGPGPLEGLAVGAIVLATAFSLCLGQYVSWTMTGAAAIEGIQGRYLIPLLGFAALTLPSLALPGAPVLRWVFRLPVMAVAFMGLVVIPRLVVSTYYLR